jgi:hypothetical protein
VTAEHLVLFDGCPMTGCRNLAAPGTVCESCVEAFRPYIRRRGAREISDTELSAVLAEYATPEPDPNPGCGIHFQDEALRCYQPDAHKASAANHVRCDVTAHHEPDLTVTDEVAGVIEIKADRVMARLQREAAHDRGEAYKPNQRCWVCEERRSCRLDPDFADSREKRLICKTCEEIQ